MIKINYSKKQNCIEYLSIKGHANYAIKGQDIVCSAVSAIIVGGLNALDTLENYDIEMEEGNVLLIVKEEISNHDKNVLDTIFIQLLTIAESYSEYVKIEETKGW